MLELMFSKNKRKTPLPQFTEGEGTWDVMCDVL